ncbi:MAG: 4'-phosphopantetheinyl transferase family protein [Pseudanabaenaceae cyanobacterium]
MSNSFHNSMLIKIGSISHRVDGTFLAEITENAAIDLWLADFSIPNIGLSKISRLELTAHYWQILSETEQERAALMGAQRQQQFILTRGILRELLSSYIGIAPQYLKLATSPKGKPYLDYAEPQYQIPFNVSHAENLALYAVMPPNFGPGRENLGAVGIDLELLNRDLPVEKITKLVKRYFLPQEQKIWFRYLADPNLEPYLEPHLAKVCFLRAWTAKEAYAKATGLGLAHTLTHLDTSPWLTLTAIPFQQVPSQRSQNICITDLELRDLEITVLNQSDNIHDNSACEVQSYKVRDLSVLLSESEVPCVGAVCWQQFNRNQLPH